ncbi:MAG: hypothetical protein ACK5L5_09050 [Bacteroidales bacterium]
MDDFLYYLLIIVFVLVQLFGFLNKKKKEDAPKYEEGEDEDIIGKLKEILGDKTSEVPTPSTSLESYLRSTQFSTPETPPVLESCEEGVSSIMHEDLSSKLEGKKHIRKKSNHLLKDFSLRKAVIYSEIIKPKYF